MTQFFFPKHLSLKITDPNKDEELLILKKNSTIKSQSILHKEYSRLTQNITEGASNCCKFAKQIPNHASNPL
ncbi:hypothetical protein BC643_4593 [Mangrovibacterium diazotrophicum]|uniref:Uncharacterized protein n=1 Tax=Mangrovibacterium diazotrophicum TaxID=1261403 RepID=A0A419VUF9_9BACT|nr:hypothetical protein BC643_4593 [Mangrovibacterium diazotrophicum]